MPRICSFFSPCPHSLPSLPPLLLPLLSACIPLLPEVADGMKTNPPDSAAVFGRIAPNRGRIAGFLENKGKLYGKTPWRRRRPFMAL